MYSSFMDVHILQLQLFNFYIDENISNEGLGFYLLYRAILPVIGAAHLVYVSSSRNETVIEG